MGRKMNKLQIEKIIYVIIHMFLILVFIFGFTYVKFAVRVGIFILTVASIVRKKWLRFAADLMLMVVLFFASRPGRYAWMFYDLEQIRFHLLQNQYQKTVEKLLNNLEESEELNYLKIENPLLSSGNRILYRKLNNSVMILFTTEYIDISGYAWYSDDEAYNWMKSEYYFYLLNPLDEEWAMFQMYP